MLAGLSTFLLLATSSLPEDVIPSWSPLTELRNAMRSTIAIALSLALPFYASPLTAQNDAGKVLSVAEVWSSPGAVDSPFGTVDGMTETDKGEIWVTDGMCKCIVVLDSTGEFVRSIGRSGEGPGEFVGPGRLATTNNSVAVFDISRSSIELFDAQGQFLKRTLLDQRPFNIKGFLVLEDGSFVLSGGIDSKAYAVHRFDSTGAWADGFGHPPESDKLSAEAMQHAQYVTGGPITLLEDGELLYSRAAPHRIVTRIEDGGVEPFAEDPALLRPIVDSFAYSLVEDGTTRMRLRWFFDQSRSITALDGVILNSITFEKRGETLWQAYDGSGSLIASSRSPVEYWVWGRTRDGDLLATRWNAETGEQAAVRLRVSVSDG
jgi:hypothetical protein